MQSVCCEALRNRNRVLKCKMTVGGQALREDGDLMAQADS